MKEVETPKVRLTEYSHGAGCGCKIAPAMLEDMLSTKGEAYREFSQLLVGNEASDDAAVVSLDGNTAIVSTTDFFMPIVDDPRDFGAIAATNAMSDVYAMGAEPIMAIAILGWPTEKLAPEIAGQVLDGGRNVCYRAGIPLAGGHSIDAPEPIFGLAVTGKLLAEHIKRNQGAEPGDRLYLTKPLGIGTVATAQKKGLVDDADMAQARDSMLQLNDIGVAFAQREEVNAITDVTGFGLGGHLLELCDGSGVSAEIERSKVPVLDFMDKYLEQGSIPGGSHRNWESYSDRIRITEDKDRFLLADPQTSGGLLVSVSEKGVPSFEEWMAKQGDELRAFGRVCEKKDGATIEFR
ncbi:MAG: selenide, water dikinase SelD [Flavobacteriales bacterium]